MNETAARNKITLLLKADALRMAMLKAVAELQLPDCYVAAGFLRNLVWDHMHGFEHTALNDIDVVFFEQAMSIAEQQQQKLLEKQFPPHHFDVKNQARMHLKHGHRAYSNSRDAMSYWVELETAIGVRINGAGDFEYAAPFGLAFLFNGQITLNPGRPPALFYERITNKQWLNTWPQLKVAEHE